MAGRRWHSPEQIVRKLREADKLLGQGQEMAVVLKHVEISEQTLYRWRKVYGDMTPDEARCMRELEDENKRLKKVVADQALQIDMLKEVAKGNF
jgi:putative transposase